MTQPRAARLRVLVAAPLPADVGAVAAILGTAGHEVLTAYRVDAVIARLVADRPDILVVDPAIGSTPPADLLGRPPALYGTVVRGDGRGHALGYPTANLDLGGELRPARGVYGASVEIDGVRRAAVVNIGGRPTFYPEGEARETVEVHVLDWQGDLYGRNLEAVLLGKIRDESRFASADDLRAQIARDVETMRERVAAGAWKLG